LRELGINPARLFDTELAGRIAGLPRVGLGPLLESIMGVILAKEHSAADWSARPLPKEWLTYAALDVELLVELRNHMYKILEDAKKLPWALEEFASILNAPPAPPRVDPWRRTSGIHKIRDLTALAIIRALWAARNEFAKEIDLAPGRVFNDETLVLIATKPPKGFGDFKKALLRRTRLTSMPFEEWFRIFEAAQQLTGDELPKLRMPAEGLPAPKMWQSRNPLGYARLTHARAAVLECAAQNFMPPENLISPEAVRRVCWPNPPTEISDRLKFVSAELAEFGARSWQIELVATPIAAILGEIEPLIVEVPAAEGESADGAESQTPESDELRNI
jgi:ribonuclease D